tara:strand:+ start:753 stop:1052 length:300 start_codon:yes stop_codon:yes gene_type:complete
MNPYPGYYSVFDPNGKKIADCGSISDAITLIGSRNKKWEGHYYQFIPTMGQIVDVSQYDHIELPTRDIVVNMDGGVGGSWKEIKRKIISESDYDEVFSS